MRKLPIAFAAIAALILAGGTAAAQTVDEIHAKHVAAKGGDKWDSVQTMRMTARIVTQGIELPMTMVSKRPNLLRQDMSFQGVSIVNAFDGTTAWGINPMMGSSEPSVIPGPMADALADQADFDGSLVSYKAQGSTVELVCNEAKVCTEELDGRKVHHLKLTKKNNQVQHYYLDAETALEAKLIAETDMGTGPVMVETLLSDYQTVDGFPVPMTIRQTGPTGQVAITVEKVEFNVPIDDAFFKMPGK